MLLMLMPFASTFVLIWPCPGHQMGAQWHVTRGILTITCRIRDPATGRIPHLTVIMQCLLTAGHLTPWPQTMRRSQGQTSDTISSVSISLGPIWPALYTDCENKKRVIFPYKELYSTCGWKLWKCDILKMMQTSNNGKTCIANWTEFSGLEWDQHSPDLVVAQSVSSIWL